MRTRLVLVLAITFTFTLCLSAAHAQLETFVQAVGELAEATRQSEPLRSNDIRIAATRMGTALLNGSQHQSLGGSRRARERRRSGFPRVSTACGARRGVSRPGPPCRCAAGIRHSRRAPALVIRSAGAASAHVEAAGRSEEAGQAFRTAWNLDPTNPVKAYYVAQWPGAGSAADRAPARAFSRTRPGKLGPTPRARGRRL